MFHCFHKSGTKRSEGEEEMKIKILSSPFLEYFNNDLNAYIKNKEIVDIEFATCYDSKFGRVHYTALIMYRE